MLNEKYKRLRVYLDTENTNKYENKYNKSYVLWEYLKMEVPEYYRNYLGLYAPDYHASTEADYINGNYIQTYTIGDLLNFLHYNYWYESLYSPVDDDNLIIHRRLTILPIPIDRVDRIKMYEELDSSVKNCRTDYLWRISIDDEVLGEAPELVDALYDAINVVYFERKLYKIPLRFLIGLSVPGEYDVNDYTQTGNEKRFIKVVADHHLKTLLDGLDANAERDMDLIRPHYRGKNIGSNGRGQTVEVYDAGDLISMLFYNYYHDVTLRLKDGSKMVNNRRITIIPEPNGCPTLNDDYNHELTNRTEYKWTIRMDGDILGKKEHLVDALRDAVILIYKNKVIKDSITYENVYTRPLYKIIHDEIQNYNIEVLGYEEQKEFSLADV